MSTILDFIQSGIYDFFVGFFSYVIIALGFIAYKVAAFGLEFFLDVGIAIMDNLSISTYLEQFLNQIDSDIVSFITYVKGFDALMIILNAKITRYMMSIIGI